MLIKDKPRSAAHEHQSQAAPDAQIAQAGQRKRAASLAPAAPTAAAAPIAGVARDAPAAPARTMSPALARLCASAPPKEYPGPLQDWTNAVFRPDLYRQPSRTPDDDGAGGQPVQCKPEQPASSRPAPAPPAPGHGPGPAPASGSAPAPTQAGPVLPAEAESVQPGHEPDTVADAIQQALARHDPVAGVGAPREAWRLLGALSMAELMPALAELRARGVIGQLYSDQGALTGELRMRLDAAQKTLDIDELPPGQAAPGLLVPLASAVEALPSAQDKTAIYRYLFAKRQHWMDLDRLLEGATAMHNADVHTRGEMLPQAAMGALGPNPKPIEPGPWAKPPDQPGSLYVGNAIHKAIAEEYKTPRRSEIVFTNQVPVASILDRAETQGHGVNLGALTADERTRMPDIVNLTRLYLYEIKPEAYAAEGKAKLALYMGIFAKAGLTLSLGPSHDAGTEGALPAPGGVCIFFSPEPGLITYSYRKGRLVPVPVPQTERQPNEAASKWRWELEPLTPEQQAMVAASVGMAMLILLMILLAPVGA